MPTADETPVQPSPELLAAGGAAPWFGKLGQREFDIDFFERVLKRQPHDVRLLRLLGEMYARVGKHGDSLAIDLKLVELLPDDSVAHYNLACSLAMLGDSREAIDQLSQAITLGYNDFEHLEVDPDLDSLRSLPEYQALLQQAAT